MVEQQRQKLMTELGKAEADRQAAADALAAAETAHREAAQALRAAQGAVADEREGRARAEARLEGARVRRSEEARKIRDALGCAPEACLALAQLRAGRPASRRSTMPTLSFCASRPTASGWAASTCRRTRTSPGSPSSSRA